MNSNPWEMYPKIWKTQSAFMSFLRSGIRKSLWNRNPIKIEFIKKFRKKITNPNPRGRVADVWGATCYLCENDFPLNLLEIDHLVGNHSLKTVDDIQGFIQNMVFVSEKDLAFACKNCHRCKSYAERTGVDFETARTEKAVIEICKNKQDKQWLLDKGVIPLGNAKLRRQQITEEMMK